MTETTTRPNGPRADLLARLTRRGLYLVTDDRLEDAPLLERLSAALDAGADVVQLRDKRPGRGRSYDLGKRVAERCRAAGALFIVNDFADLAVALEADGVHVGQDDLPPAAARAVVGPARLVGLSVSAVDEAVAVDGAADYLGFGSLFPTATKPDAEPAGPDLLAEARRQLGPSLPLVGIGGVSAANAPTAIRAGADSVAVVSAIFGADDVARATRDLLAAIENARAVRKPPS
jgi:thiamine-phosphate pyrophosphorylase